MRTKRIECSRKHTAFIGPHNNAADIVEITIVEATHNGLEGVEGAVDIRTAWDQHRLLIVQHFHLDLSTEKEHKTKTITE